MGVQRQKSLQVAARCQRPLLVLGTIVACFAMAVLGRWYKGGIGNRSLLSCTPTTKPYRSSWHGTNIYPTVSSRDESWQWLLTFLRSVPPPPSPGDEENVAYEMIAASAEPSGKDISMVSIRFPNTTVVPLELRVSTKINSNNFVAIPRYECRSRLCQPVQKGTRIATRLDFPAVPQRNVVFINFLHCDDGDADRVIRELLGSEILVTVFRTENADQEKDLNYALVLYELFQKIYFDYKWVPAVANWKQCERQRYGCQMWILWKPWSFTGSGTYMPPAGDGSLHSELNRINRFFTNPDRDACSSIQGIGGQDTRWPFVDGLWSICLDTLQKVTPSTCTVYSFGIADDWSFDDSMHSFGCSVYSFDPSIKQPAHRRNTNHWFYPWGLGIRKNGWKMMSFEQIRKKLNHTGHLITVLKIDIESDEWTFLNSPNLPLNLKDVHQLTFETHPSNDMRRQPRTVAFLLHRLEKIGFRMYKARQNANFLDARIARNNTMDSEYFYEPAFIKKSRVRKICI